MEKDDDTLLTVKFKKIIRSCSSRSELHSLFKSFDQNNDKSVSRIEFKNIISKVYKYKLYPKELEHLYKRYDQDNNGSISYTEFLDVIFPEAYEHCKNAYKRQRNQNKKKVHI